MTVAVGVYAEVAVQEGTDGTFVWKFLDGKGIQHV